MSRKRPKNKRSRSRKSSPTQGLSAFAADSASGLALLGDIAGSKAVKFITGLLLLPVCWILLETFLVLLQADTLVGQYWKSKEFLAFGLASLLSITLFFVWRSRIMMWLYVAGHELTHALFVLLCRGKVTKVHISPDGGHILTNRNNFVISLSPYFFPFYSAVAILGWAITEWIIKDAGTLDPLWLYALIGFTWMFHLTFTLWMIIREQPDVDQNGKLFSFTVIFSVNVLLICTMLIVASPTATFKAFGLSLWANGGSFFTRLSESALEMYELFPFG